MLQRVAAIIRRPGTLVAAPLLLVGLAIHLAGGGGAGVPIVAVGVVGAMLLHQDQLVRLRYRADQVARQERHRSDIKLDHIIERQLTIEREVRRVSARQVDPEFVTNSLAALLTTGESLGQEIEAVSSSIRVVDQAVMAAVDERKLLADRLASLDGRSSERVGEVYRRLDSAHWHRERLYGLHADTLALRDVLAGRRDIPRLRNWALSPDVSLFLAHQIRDGGVRRVLELGSGASTEIVARMLQLVGSGRVVAVDHEQSFAEQTSLRLEAAGLGEWADVHHCPLVRVDTDGGTFDWYDLEGVELGEGFDLLLVDGPPTTHGSMTRLPAETLFKNLRSGGLILLDDADRGDEREIAARWAQRTDLVSVEVPHFEKGLAVFRKA